MAEQRNYASDVADLDAIEHPDHKALHDHWYTTKPEGGLPSRDSFDPADFGAMLPRIAVIEPIETVDPGGAAGRSFRYRLAGTEIVERAGRDPTGKTFDELYTGIYLDTARQTYEQILTMRAPHFSQRVFPIGDGESELRYDRLILPFARDHQTIDSFLLCIVVVSQSGTVKVEGSFKRYT